MDVKSALVLPITLDTKTNGVLINTWRPRQNGRRFPDDIFKYIFLN